jgi:hypothetical protein
MHNNCRSTDISLVRQVKRIHPARTHSSFSSSTPCNPFALSKTRGVGHSLGANSLASLIKNLEHLAFVNEDEGRVRVKGDVNIPKSEMVVGLTRCEKVLKMEAMVNTTDPLPTSSSTSRIPNFRLHFQTNLENVHSTFDDRLVMTSFRFAADHIHPPREYMGTKDHRRIHLHIESLFKGADKETTYLPPRSLFILSLSLRI